MAGWEEYEKYGLQEIIELGFDGIKLDDDYVIFEPTQIKSIHNEGNFDPYNTRILEQSAIEPRLSSLHNLTSENLIHADELGGLAVPSIAVVKGDMATRGYGDITLIGTKELADPEQVPVFDADAYTTTFPTPDYPKSKVAIFRAFLDEITPFLEKFDKNWSSTQYTLETNAIDYPNPEKTVNDLLRSSAAKAMFLSETEGVSDLKPVMMNVPLRHDVSGQPEVKAFFKELNKKSAKISKQMQAFREKANDKYGPHRQWPDTAVNRLNQLDSEHSKQLRVESLDNNVEALTELSDLFKKLINEQYDGSFVADRLIESATGDDGLLHFATHDRMRDDQRFIGKKQVDSTKTERRLDRAIKGKEAEFQSWLHNKILSLHGEPTVKVGRRNMPYTLPNIVENMTDTNVQANENTIVFGEGNARAATATQFGDLEWMRNASYQIEGESEISEAREKAKVILEEYRQNVINYYTDVDWRGNIDTFGALDGSMKAIAKFAKRGGGPAALRKALNSEGFSRVPMSILEQGVKAKNALINAPVPYFEAKPLRAVGLSEFPGAVVPRGVDQKVIDILEKNNIEYVKYGKKFDEQAREKAVIKLRKKLDKAGKLTLFQNNKQNNRGYIRFGGELKGFEIGLLEKADSSTFIHELGHYYLEVMGDLALADGAPESLAKDYDTVLKWLNAKDRESLSVKQLEKFARGFEAYLYEGNAPSQGMRDVFAKFSTWLKAVYKHIKELNVTLTDDVRGVFDRLLICVRFLGL